MLHKTRGIVLRTIRYGETSIIASVYTELFGLQSYIIKGIRSGSKSARSKSGYFQHAAILELDVYHNEQKQLNYVKEYQWAYLYENLLFDVVRNAVASYIVELVQHSLKEPESNPSLFYLVEETLHRLDKGAPAIVANLPLYFILQLGSEMGFQIQGSYSTDTPYLDLRQGYFTEQLPLHPNYLEKEEAEISSTLLHVKTYDALGEIRLNQTIRRQLIKHYQQYLGLHIADFGELRSFAVLQDILS